MSLISIMLKGNMEQNISIIKRLKSSDFFHYIPRGLFEIIKVIIAESREINLFNILAEVQKHKRLLDELGGTSKFAENIEVIKQADCNIDESNFYIENILKYSVARQLIQNTSQMTEKILNAPDISLDELTAYPQALAIDIQLGIEKQGNHISIGLDRILSIDQKDIGKLLGFPSRYQLLNKYTLGYRKKKLYVFSAPSHQGKSTFILNEADNLGIDLKIPCLIIDTENLQEDQLTNLLSIRTELDPNEIATGLYLNDPLKVKKVRKAAQEINEAQIWFESIDDFSEDSLGSLIQYYKLKHHIQIVFFDYIKIPFMNRMDKLNETQKLGNLTTYLKNNIAKKQDLTVISACQTDQFDEERIANSARIFQYADFIGNWHLRRGEDGNFDQASHELNIQKNRGGKRNISLKFKFSNSYCAKIIEGDNSHLAFAEQSTMIPKLPKPKSVKRSGPKW